MEIAALQRTVDYIALEGGIVYRVPTDVNVPLITLSANILRRREIRSHVLQPTRRSRAVINHEFIDDESVLDGIALILDKDDFGQPAKL